MAKKGIIIISISLVLLTVCILSIINDKYAKEEAQVSGLTQIETDNLVDAIFEANPIDGYFTEMAQKIIPATTLEMVEYWLISCAAWEAEMVNCYEILKSKTKDNSVRKCLDDDKNSYIEYIKNNAELYVYFAAEAFMGEENVLVGSMSRVDRISAWEYGYRKKTLELFHRLYEIGITPQFVFSEDEYREQIQETFPALWEKAFG